MENIVIEPKVETPVVEEVKKEVPKVEIKEDLVTRVSKVKIESSKSTEEQNSFGLTQEDYEKVKTDPVLSKFYKSMQSDYVKKTQQIADIRKDFEKQKEEISNWTPERIQKELNNPSFVQAAQTVAKSQNPPNSGLTDEEYSALSEKEKSQIQSMQNELLQLKQQQFISQIRQQDEQLKQKFSNYDPNAVDVLTSDLLSGKLQATREHLWKVMDYENAMQRAYELGKQDRELETNEKINASSFQGLTTQNPTREVPLANSGESSQNHFKRIAVANLARMKQ